MVEEVLFKSEQERTREEIASYLRTIAEKLEAGESITLEAGSDSTTLSVPPRSSFEVKAEREGTAPNTEVSVEFELEWDEGDDGRDDALTIE